MPPLLVIAHFFKKSFIILSLPSNFSVITLSTRGIRVLKSKIPFIFCRISARICASVILPTFPSPFFTLKIIFISSFGIVSATSLIFLNVKTILAVSVKVINFEMTFWSRVFSSIKSCIGPLSALSIFSILNKKDHLLVPNVVGSGSPIALKSFVKSLLGELGIVLIAVSVYGIGTLA